ncbi:2-aminoethanethiol dioxygenase [Parasteatoda tepidariorum]|uniref:2-aminoethanethiol dioxygenase n=1 Tax=Parasteatoda tepidariorum TaxID=114398 RepID=UPI00077FD370|nr:2-aminoethanethiol dioxygenase [Parasteatoda tepidariorum]
MSSLVEVIAKQAQATFSKSLTEENFAESFTKLIRNVARIRSSDLKLNKETIRTINSGNSSKSLAPVTYIEVAENQCFSMGIFLLKSGARIPLHDHPGMHGVLKVIQGTLKISSYSALSKVPGEVKLPQDISNRIKSSQKDRLIPVEKHSPENVTDKDEPCVLRPKESNFHEICAIGGTAAFLDILAPPYDMKERDCHYYVPLETNKTDSEVKTWLLRTSPPTDFWCDAAPYTGPKVSL